jgi:hypothetical protein
MRLWRLVTPRLRVTVLWHMGRAKVTCVLRQVLRLHPPVLPLQRRAAVHSVMPRLLLVPLRHRLPIEADRAGAGRGRCRAELRPVHAPQRRRQLLLLMMTALELSVQVLLLLMLLLVLRRCSALQLRRQ